MPTVMPYLMETDATAIPDALKTAFSWVVGNSVTMIGIVTGNAVLCLGLAMWAAGGAIGLFKRLV